MAENTAEQMDNLLDAEGRRRRKDRPLVEKKRHPLETVPFFDRPMGASIKDVQVGEDDIGNPVFKTKLGDTYTVRLNPDQRTTRTKIEEDVLPAVKQYLQDPQLPTKEQVVGAGKAVAGAIKETVSTPKKLLTGEKSAADVTMGDVFDTAGMMAMGSIPFEVPEGSVRIFGGASAKKLDIKNFAKAEKLYEDGLDPESIRKETGWFKDDVDRKWRFEIDDSKLKLTGEDYPVDFSDSSGQDAWYNYVDEINENRLDDFSFGIGGSDGATLKLKDFLKHPKLYKHYPQLKDYTIEVGVNIDGDTIGTFDPTTKTIQLSNQIQDLDELKDVLVHEVQHAVQNIEGFLPGSNVFESAYLATSKFMDEAKDISKTLKSYGYEVTEENLDDYDFLRNASYHLQNQNPNLSDAQEYSALKYLKRLEDLGQRMGDVKAFRYQYYRNRSGEIEANLVEKRRSFDEEQRKLYSPISGKQGQITRPQAYRVADSVVQARQGQSDILLDTVNFDYVPSKDNPSRYVYQYKDKQSSNYGELYDEAIRDFLKSNKDTKKLASLKTGDTVTLNSDGREYFFVEFRPYSEMIRKLDKNYPHVFHEAMGERIEHDKVAGVTLVRIPRGTTKKQRKEIIKYIKNPPVETIDSPPSSVPENFTKFKEFSLGDLMFNSNKSKAKPEATASFRDANFSPNTDSGRLSKINKDFQRALFLQGKAESVARYSDKVEPEVYDAFVELADIQRGAPEVAMTKAQFDLGGGVLGYTLEHTGDLTHRMAEYGGRFGDEYVKPKIDRIFNLLTNDYGFEKEVKENLLSNIKYQFQTEKPNISLKEYEKQYREKVSKSLQKYADEHKKVPVYNDMQLAGREAAIAMGEGRYDDALENIYIIKKAIDEGNYSERSLEFDPKIDFRKPKEFAEGGLTMKDQMEMAFMQEGGLKDDGMDIDPVSGNEVPPGSMAKEVRDDIPAQLSEGEYVVPADVVQYYGVKFFEDLRMEAKRGLADMEANGRIGGEPVDMPMDMPMDDTPTVAVSTGGYIDGIPAAEYNVGGMASNLYNNPTQMDQEVNNIISTMYNNPQVMDELARRGIQVNRTQAQMMPQQMNQANPPSQARMGMNPGGLTSNEILARDYITSPTIPGSTYLTPGATSIYTSPPELTTSATASNMPSVEYCNSIDMDYNPSTKMCVPREMAQTPQQTGGGSNNDGPEPPKPEPWFNNVNWEDPTAQMDSFFGKEGRVGSAIAGVAGSMIGGPLVGGALTFGAQVSNLAQARAMANVYDAMGMSKEAQDIRDKVNGITEQNKALGIADDTINKFVGSDGDMLTISAMKAAGIDVPRGLRDDELQDYLKDLSDESRKALRNKYAPNYKDPVVTPTKDDDKDDGPGSTPKPDDNDDFIKSVIKDPESFLPPSTVDSSGSGSTNPGDRGFTPGAPEPKPEPKPSSIYDDDKAGDYDDDSTGINKGGLMSKKKKKKK